jgi:hypothetical protein
LRDRARDPESRCFVLHLLARILRLCALERV